MAEINDSGIESVQVLEIDLDKKNILIIVFSDYQSQENTENVAMMLREWLQRDNDPLFVLGCENGVEIRLEKIDNE